MMAMWMVTQTPFATCFFQPMRCVTIENGNIVDNTSYNGRITPQSGATGGGAAGNFFFNVRAN